jgi:protein-glutamine gamma-glutamyltransferase
MRRVAKDYEGYYQIYTRLLLPVSLPGTRHHKLTRVDPGLWPSPGMEDPLAPRLIRRSPYAPMYRVATRLATGAPTAYDVALRFQNYLNSNRFVYDEHPARRRFPLESFLIKDRVGYCQQFSGAMALMLRMVGIPARVATGFAPGTQQTNAPGVYRVRDYDAHSWVEVYFRDIGWVTFDPTPSSSPASLQTDDRAASAVGQGRTPRGLGQSQGPEPVGGAGAVNLSGRHGSGFSWWMVPVAVAALAVLLPLGIRVRSTALHRAALPPDERALEDLCSALARLGSPLAAGATLTTLESTLQRAGPDAARYARLLREYRYGPNGAALPRARDRRALRKALARTARPFGRLKALRALPPLHL